jgi:hypothetical protein
MLRDIHDLNSGVSGTKKRMHAHINAIYLEPILDRGALVCVTVHCDDGVNHDLHRYGAEILVGDRISPSVGLFPLLRRLVLAFLCRFLLPLLFV